MSEGATRSRPLLPAFLALVLALAMLLPAGPGLSVLQGKVLHGLAVFDAAIVAPERASWTRAEGAGREDDPSDGLTAAQAARAGPVVVPLRPASQLVTPDADCRTACARGPPAPIA
jgi:hypothetical protein